MHEVELANRILTALRYIAVENKAKVQRVNMRVGDLNEPRRLRIWLAKLGGDEFRGAKFNITRVPPSIVCKCGYSGKFRSAIDIHSPAPELGITCPKCGGHELKLTSGMELEIINVELKRGERFG